MTSISVQTSFGPVGVSAGFAGTGPVALKAAASPLVVVSSTPGQQGLTGAKGDYVTGDVTGQLRTLAANQSASDLATVLSLLDEHNQNQARFIKAKI